MKVPLREVTSEWSPPTEAYLDMLYSNNLLPVISKPTRLIYHSATLIIDHIYAKRQLSQKKQKLCTKPWIINGIVK